MVSMMLVREMRLECAPEMWSQMKNRLHFTAAGWLSAISSEGVDNARGPQIAFGPKT